MTSWNIAQLNVATAKYDLDQPEIADFVNQLDEINELAEESPGFVWRLKDESGNATDVQTTDDPRFIVNMSVWTSVEDLFQFVYKTAHQGVMQRRREWFHRPDGAFQVLWWVEAGHEPDVKEALERLEHFNTHGPSARAFGFKSVFPPPDVSGEVTDLEPEPLCVGWS